MNDDSDVYIRMPLLKVAPMDTGITERVQKYCFQSAGHQKAAPVPQSVSVRLPAPASQQ